MRVPCALMALIVLAASPAATGAEDFSKQTGQEIFQRLCASCHGKTGEGDGPVVPILRTRPPDLTLIAKRYGSLFPEKKIRESIDGRAPVTAHGPRDMPIWGVELRLAQGFDAQGGRKTSVVLDKLVQYLKSIQKPVRIEERTQR